VAKLSIRTDDTPQGTIVKVVGDVSVTEVDEFERQLMAVADRQTPQFVLDLSGLTYAASLAIGCLLRFSNQVTAAGGRVALADVQPMVHDSFRRAQLHRVFTIYPTVREALGDNVVT
jgi:anti-sigma B factor antagonist